MGSLPIDPCLLHVSYLTVEVLEVASCILLKTRERKEKKKKKVQHSTPEHPQQHHESCLQRPLLQHSLAWLQSGQQQNVRPVQENSMQVLPVIIQQGCWGLSQGCQPRRIPVDTSWELRALEQGQMYRGRTLTKIRLVMKLGFVWPWCPLSIWMKNSWKDYH